MKKEEIDGCHFTLRVCEVETGVNFDLMPAINACVDRLKLCYNKKDDFYLGFATKIFPIDGLPFSRSFYEEAIETTKAALGGKLEAKLAFKILGDLLTAKSQGKKYTLTEIEREEPHNFNLLILDRKIIDERGDLLNEVKCTVYRVDFAGGDYAISLLFDIGNFNFDFELEGLTQEDCLKEAERIMTKILQPIKDPQLIFEIIAHNLSFVGKEDSCEHF